MHRRFLWIVAPLVVSTVAAVALVSLASASPSTTAHGLASDRIAFVLNQPIGADPALKGYADAFKAASARSHLKGLVVESADIQAIGDNVRRLAASGYGLIIVDSPTALDAAKSASASFPKTKFAIIDVAVDDPHLRSVSFKEYESGFLVGVEAALLSKTHKVGFVGGMDVPVLVKFWGGMREGIQYAQTHLGKKVSFDKRFTGTFADVGKGKEVALAEINSGVDYILAASGAGIFGTFEACADKKIYCVGTDQDYRGTNPFVIESMMKRTDVAIQHVISDYVVNRKPWAAEVVYGLREGGVGLASVSNPKPISNRVLGTPRLQRLRAITREIIAGKIVVKNPLAK